MVTLLYRLDHEGWCFLTLHSSATIDMNCQALEKDVKVYCRVIPLLAADNIQADVKSLYARSGRPGGWSAEKMMLSGDPLVVTCMLSMSVRPGEVE